MNGQKVSTIYLQWTKSVHLQRFLKIFWEILKEVGRFAVIFGELKGLLGEDRAERALSERRTNAPINVCLSPRMNMRTWEFWGIEKVLRPTTIQDSQAQESLRGRR